MHSLIIDDNPKTAQALKEMLEAVDGMGTVHLAVQPYLVRSLMAIELIEIVFIRTRLWDYHVFEKLEVMPVVVFLTGGKDKLTDQAGTTVPYKLREPYAVPDTRQLLSRLIKQERIIELPSYFFVRTDGRFHRLFFEHIEMVERMQMGYIKIWTRFNSFLISGTLNHVLNQLPQGRFIRVSDTLVLPLQQARLIDGDEYEFRGRKIPLTFRFAALERRELEQQSNWANWPSN